MRNNNVVIGVLLMLLSAAVAAGVYLDFMGVHDACSSISFMNPCDEKLGWVMFALFFLFFIGLADAAYGLFWPEKEAVVRHEHVGGSAPPAPPAARQAYAKCHFCGTMNDAQARFCVQCGKPVDFVPYTGESAAAGAATAPEGFHPGRPAAHPRAPVIVCPHCRSPNAATSRICERCGQPLPLAPAGSESALGSPGASPVPRAAHAAPCPNCGTPVPASVRVCPHCGAHIAAHKFSQHKR